MQSLIVLQLIVPMWFQKTNWQKVHYVADDHYLPKISFHVVSILYILSIMFILCADFVTWTKFWDNGAEVPQQI